MTLRKGFSPAPYGVYSQQSAWHFIVPPSPPTLVFLAFREFDDALGLTLFRTGLPFRKDRTGRDFLQKLVPLLRKSIYSRLARNRTIPMTLRWAYPRTQSLRVIHGIRQGSERKGASNCAMGRFETEFLTQEDIRQALASNEYPLDGTGDGPHPSAASYPRDMDSSESPVQGQQVGAAYNGHFECVCYHPLFLFNQFGDCEGAKLRSGNVQSADAWQEVLDPVVERYFTAAVRLLFRADAALDKPEIYEYVETR